MVEKKGKLNERLWNSDWYYVLHELKTESRKHKRQWVEFDQRRKINLNFSDTSSKGKLIRSNDFYFAIRRLIIKKYKIRGRTGAKVGRKESCNPDG